MFKDLYKVTCIQDKVIHYALLVISWDMPDKVASGQEQESPPFLKGLPVLGRDDMMIFIAVKHFISILYNISITDVT